MSGGAFDYLCMAYDLNGVFERQEQMAMMATTLRDWGHDGAAAETEALHADLERLDSSVMDRVERLRGVWKAVEWTTSFDWGPDSVTEAVQELESLTDPSRVTQDARVRSTVSIFQDWPDQPTWAGNTEIVGADGDADGDPDQTIERQFSLEVTVGGSTARVEETHLRMEGQENAGLIEKIGPLVSFSPDDLTPEMAADTLTALTELLASYNRA
ncbi:hypothetical protein [Arthrobacter sp. UYCo732]|uniref:hypothetical protein n=1 Tax=Arthrobacter sp. UYCo732 TaxID=3156336 RepID=UPI003394EFB0